MHAVHAQSRLIAVCTRTEFSIAFLSLGQVSFYIPRIELHYKIVVNTQ